MELSRFIASHREAILSQWEKDARRRIPGEQRVDISQLRGNWDELLSGVARDLSASEVTSERADGQAEPRKADQHIDAAAELHGARRAQQRMNVKQVVSEFPILRASVSRLWLETQPVAQSAECESLVRFDEAVDRALTQSLTKFMDQLDQSRVTFLGILGHDLRDPLATIITGGRLFLEGELDSASARDVVERIVATGERMHHLVADLLDAMRTRVAGRMPIARRECDLGNALRQITGEFRTSHPERVINLTVSGDPRGNWDDKRLSQAVANLVANAVSHGAPETPISIDLAAGDEVTIAVHNEGPPIPAARRESLFEPLIGATPRETGGDPSEHLGLGLYIAKSVVEAHDGRIEVDSAEGRGTTFRIHLPRAREPMRST